MAFPSDSEGTWFNDLGVSLDAGELRRADSAAFGGIGSALGVGGGIVRHGDTSLAVTVDGSDVVTIQPGAVVIPGNAVSGTGPYRGAVATAFTGSLTARNVTNGRIDLVVFRALDTDVVPAHAAYKMRVDIIAGTPSGSPAVPALPTMAVELARITVPNTGGGTVSVDLSHRTFASAVGGDLVVPTLSMLPAAAATRQRATALDTGLRYEWSGAAWTPPDYVNWTDASLGSGFSHATDRTQWTRNGRIVTLGISATKGSITAGQTVCTLPAGARPSRKLFFAGMYGNTFENFQVQADGLVTINTTTSAGGATGIVSFPVA